MDLKPKKSFLLSHVTIPKTMTKEISERSLDYKEFSYYPSLKESLESFPEINVSIGFTFGKGIPESFSGHSQRITNDDQNRMEALSFYEAANSAWLKYKNSSYPDRRKYVKEKLSNKWKELSGYKLVGKKLNLAKSDPI